MKTPGKALKQLLLDGQLPLSACSAALLRWLRPMLATGVVVRVRSGVGERLEARQPEVLRRFVDQQFPGGIDAGAGSRSAAVLNWRDSKLAAPDAPAVILIRGLADARLSAPGAEVDLGLITARHGAFALAVDDLGGYRLHGDVAVIENREVFFAAERLVARGLPARSFVYAAGRLDERVRRWLAAQTNGPEPIRLCHAGDYDASGLCDYLALRLAGAQASLYLPEHLEALLARHGKPGLKVTSAELERLQRQLADPAVNRVRAWMARYACGLEQEALLGGAG